MSEHTDPFAKITAQLGMGEWPEDGFETIPPYRIAELQQSLVDHLVAMEGLPEEDGVELHVALSELQRLYVASFEHVDVLSAGDKLRLSNGALLIAVDGDGNYGYDLLQDGREATAEVVRPIIMEAPAMIEMIDFESEEDNSPRQLAACVQLGNVVVRSTDDDGYVVEEVLDDESFFVCAPLIYPSMSLQRQM